MYSTVPNKRGGPNSRGGGGGGFGENLKNLLSGGPHKRGLNWKIHI